MRIESSSTAFRTCSTTPATVSPTITRMLSPAFAVEAITLRAGDPLRVVAATVVRVMAAASGPAASSARVTTGASRSARPSSGRSGSGTCGARRRISSSVGAGADAGNGDFSIRRMARAMRAVGPFLAGVEACPPRPSATSSSEVVPFSVTPMTPSGAFTPGNAPPAIAPPSSSTSHGVTPRSRSTLDRLERRGAADLLVAAEGQPDVLGGDVPGLEERLDGLADRRRRSPCRRACRGPRSPGRWGSRGSRRRTGRAATGPRRRRVRRRGGPSARPAARRSRPAQWKSSPWVPTRVSSSRSCSSGNCVASSASSRSKASASTRAGSRSETVGMRTRACRAPTTRSVMGVTVVPQRPRWTSSYAARDAPVTRPRRRRPRGGRR